MPTEPDHGAPIEVGLEAMGHLREANSLLAAAYRHAADHVGDGLMRSKPAWRYERYVPAIAQAWNEAEVEFRRACMTVAPTIDASFRLADVESIGERYATLSTHGENPVSITEVATFDQHIHELFEELQRQWPALEEQPPLAKFNDDDRALGAPWRLGFQRHPLWFVFGIGVFIYVIGRIFGMVVTQS